MTKLAHLCGIILIALGIGGYVSTGMASVTALIPSFIGVFIVISAFIAKKNVKLGMHLAVAFAFIGAAGGFMPLKRVNFDLSAGSAPYAVGMILTCIIFIIFAVRSFIAARKAK